MSRDCAILLGAGISIDAGIPSSFALTRAVYDKLREIRGSNQATLFGYVLTKLTARRVLAGGTPFDSINIEDAFDALLRLVRRDTDLLSEFVYSWDPILDSLKPQFDQASFVRLVSDSVRDQRRSLSREILSVDETRLRQAAQTISAALDSGGTSYNADRVAGTYIDILVSILASPTNGFTYMDRLVEFAVERSLFVATLNYDLLFEASARRCGRPFSYGLEAWNEKQIIKPLKDHVNLLKLHGSINWSGSVDQFSVLEEAAPTSNWRHSNALMIFGGQNSKLTPQGPFLQLRHSFENGLMRCNRLLVAGYSFGDAHINALLRRWVATRSKAKMVILDPSKIDFSLDVFAKSYSFDTEKKRKTVELVHVERTAEAGLNDALEELASRIDSEVDGSRNGFLPHVLVKRVS